MLNVDFDALEAKINQSKHNKVVPTSKSLATVLNQALSADDNETLDWVLSQQDSATISNTLSSIHDSTQLSSLFKTLVHKF